MIDENGHDFFGHFYLSGNGSDDAAVKNDRHALGLGGFHPVDNCLGLVFQVFMGELDDLWMTTFVKYGYSAILFIGDAEYVLGKLKMGIEKAASPFALILGRSGCV